MTGILSDPGVLSGRGVLSGKGILSDGGVLSVDTLKPQLLAKGEVSYGVGGYRQIGMFTSGDVWLRAGTVSKQWYLNGVAVASANPFVTLDDIQLGDELYLIETASNQYGTTESKSAVLTVAFDMRLYRLTTWINAYDASSMLNLGGVPATPGGSATAAGIATWRDLSGKGNNFTQATLANRPTLSSIANGINGVPCPSFDGSNDSLISSTLSGFSDYTLILLAKPANLTSARIMASTTNLPSTGYIGLGHSSGTRIVYPGVSFGSAAGSSTTDPEVWALRYSNGVSDAFINNANVRSEAVALTIQSTLGFRLGGNGGAAAFIGGPYSGLIGAFGVANFGLTDTDIAEISQYLAGVFGFMLVSPP